MKRIIELSVKLNVKIILSYYPPYHSKYNKIERVWASLEKHWNGSILDTRHVKKLDESIFKKNDISL